MEHEEVVVLARAALAAALAFLIGWERSVHGSPAGDRTHALVGLAAASMASLAALKFSGTGGQLVAGIVAGIGFLGGGVIFREQAGVVHGLTSAASLWASAAIGVVVGVGMPFAGAGIAAMVLLLLVWSRVPGLRLIGGEGLPQPPDDSAPRQ